MGESRPQVDNDIPIKSAMETKGATRDIITTLVEPKPYLDVRSGTIWSMFEESVPKENTAALSQFYASPEDKTYCSSSDIHLDRLCASTWWKDSVLGLFGVTTSSVMGMKALTPHVTPWNHQKEKDAILSRHLFLRDTVGNILKFKSVLGIGSGPVGTELATYIGGYINLRSRAIPVTLVDTKDHLIWGDSRYAREWVGEKLAVLSVNVILDQRAEMLEDGTWFLKRCLKPLKV